MNENRAYQQNDTRTCTYILFLCVCVYRSLVEILQVIFVASWHISMTHLWAYIYKKFEDEHTEKKKHYIHLYSVPIYYIYLKHVCN